MNKTTTALTEALIKGREIASEHPYKIVGNPDTYSQYNEAWQDCADRFEQLLISLLQKEREQLIDAHIDGQKVWNFGEDENIEAMAECNIKVLFTQYKTTDNE